ncbi:MAG: hypothetical protein R2807_05610 [Chitinophagales bacterium]
MLVSIGIAQDTTADYLKGKSFQEAQLNKPIQTDSFNKATWIELKKQLNIKDYQPEAKDEQTLNTENTDEQKDWSKSLSPKTVKIIQWTAFAMLLLALIYLVLRVLGINPFIKNKQNSIPISLEDIEENLDTADIDPHLYKAIKSKDYKLAIRLYYLMIVQKLALKEKINWKKHKTNRHYLNELKQETDKQSFSHVTTLYERYWFGDNEINESIYNEINPLFVNYLQQIK